MKHFLLFFSLLLVISCSVQKRKYQKGFYVTRIYQPANKPSQEKLSSKSEKGNASVKKVELIPVATGEKPELSADVNKHPDILLKKEKSYLLAEEDSCDVLLFRDGSEIRAKIIEVGVSDVKYRRCDNPEGPMYITRKSDLFMIKFTNGSRELMKAEEEVRRVPETTYNNYVPYRKKNRSVHPAAPFALVFGILSIIISYAGLILVAGFSTIAPIYILIPVGCALLAVILGRTALTAIKNQPDVYKGKGLAIPGLIMGAIILGIIALIFGFAYLLRI